MLIFSDLMMPQMTAAMVIDQVGNERIEKPFTAKAVRERVQRFSVPARAVRTHTHEPSRRWSRRPRTVSPPIE